MADVKNWYGPHGCSVCGDTIVKASAEEGGAEFDVPQRLLRVFLRGSEAGDPDVAYPAAWKPHVHREGGSPHDPTSTPPATA